MLLTIDVGNTSVTSGVFDKDNLAFSFGFETIKSFSSESFSEAILRNFTHNDFNPSLIQSSIISSVVPEIEESIIKSISNIFGHTPLMVDHNTKTGMPILYDYPEEVGPDRIVNSVAAYEHSGKSTIVIDFGTATTFDCISDNGEYMGGAITPGIKISSEALSRNASRLPKINIEKPGSVIGKNTVESMQSGIYYGYISLVDGMVEKIKKNMKTDPAVISTGGYSELISGGSTMISFTDPDLTLKGLNILYKLNG